MSTRHAVKQFLHKPFLRISYEASRLYHTDPLSIFFRYLRLWRQRGFFSEEAFQLGLLDPKISESELDQYYSKKSMTTLQRTLNPPSWEALTEDKSIFYKYCMNISVPIPKLYAIFFKDNSNGWSYNGTMLKDRGEWGQFLETELPPEFVIKPSRGVYGRGVRTFRSSDDGFIEASGERFHARDLYEWMCSDSRYDSFVIQELLTNHPELVRLSGTHALQTLRIVTFITSDMEVRIVHADAKIIVGENIISNFHSGATGNLTAKVFPNGTLKSAVSMNSNRPERKIVNAHPETGIRFDGFQIPHWNEACSLVKDLALKFLPLRYIGWDVAITPNGAVILEGNMWADPHNELKAMGDILAVVLSDKEKDITKKG